MGFVVLPALVLDISAAYNVYFAASKDNAVTKALFSSATAPGMTDPESELREISRLSGEERERAEALISLLWDAREKLCPKQKYIYCHVMPVHPGHQRRGIGKLLTAFGIDIAQQIELPIYFESSKEGIRLYEKLGCQRVKQPKSGEALRAAKSVNGGQDGLSLFVLVPKGSEKKLPEAVDLM